MMNILLGIGTFGVCFIGGYVIGYNLVVRYYERKYTKELNALLLKEDIKIF